MKAPFRRLTKFQGHVACVGAALVIGIPLWLVYKLSPDVFVFVLTWIIVRLIFKIWQSWEI